MHEQDKSRGITRGDLIDLSVSHIKLDVLRLNFKAGMETGKALLKFVSYPTDKNEIALLERIAHKGGTGL